MSVAAKLFGAWAVSRRFSLIVPLFFRLLTGMAAIAICTVAATVIVTLIIADGAWVANMELISSGYDPKTSAVIVGVSLLALLGVIAYIAKLYCDRFQLISEEFINLEPRGVSHVANIVNAFYEGLEQAGK